MNEVECKKCGEICMVDGDPPKVFAWCDTCSDYAEGFDAEAYSADYFARIADMPRGDR